MTVRAMLFLKRGFIALSKIASSWVRIKFQTNANGFTRPQHPICVFLSLCRYIKKETRSRWRDCNLKVQPSTTGRRAASPHSSSTPPHRVGVSNFLHTTNRTTKMMTLLPLTNRRPSHNVPEPLPPSQLFLASRRPTLLSSHLRLKTQRPLACSGVSFACEFFTLFTCSATQALVNAMVCAAN